MSEDFNIDLKKFAENAKKLKKVKEDFEKCLNAEITELEVSKNKLFNENEQIHIYAQLTKLDINSISVPKVGRVQTILDFVSQEFLAKYRNHFLTTYAPKAIPETPKRPESSDKAIIQQFNETVKKWQEEVKSIKDWNTKYNVLTEYLDSIITVDLYGDTTLNVTNLPYVYFKFLNTDIDEIEVFMQELKTCPAPPVKKIKAIRIEDIKDKLPEFVKSAKEVRVYFETEQEAKELHGSSDYVGGVYEKYVIKNDLMKKDGGEWGIHDQRKANFNNPVVGSFSIGSVPTPVNLNSGQAYEPEEEFYKDNYEVTLSECLYAEVELVGITVFAIVPKAFWEKYKSVLVNKKMKIDGVTDNPKFVRKDIYFQFMGDTSDAYSALDDAEYSSELSNYVEDYDSNKQEVINYYKNQYDLDITKGFSFEFLDDEYQNVDDLSDDEKDFYIYIYPDDDETFDQHIEDAVALFLDKTDADKLGEACECMFSFEGTVGEFKKMISKYPDMFSGDTSLNNEDEEENDEVEEEDNNYPSSEFNDEEENESDESVDYSDCKPSDCYWAIDYMNNDGEFSLLITPKDYWNKNKEVYSGDLDFTNQLVKNFKLYNNGDGSYFLYDKNSKDVISLFIIEKVMKESGFEFCKEIQAELFTECVNGFRVKYEEKSDKEYFLKASVEFANYLFNVSDEDEEVEIEDADFGDEEEYEEEFNSASDFVWSVGVFHNRLMLAITPKKYWNKYNCLSDQENLGVQNFLMKGYVLDEEAESQFSLRYANSDKYVTKLTELKLVMDKSGYEYSWDMQKFLDNHYSLVNSNKYNTSQDYFDALKVAMGQ